MPYVKKTRGSSAQTVIKTTKTRKYVKKRPRRVYKAKISRVPTINQVLPRRKLFKFHNDVMLTVANGYCGANFEKLDVAWNNAKDPWFQTFGYTTPPFSANLGTNATNLQGAFGIDDILGTNKWYDSYRVVSAKLHVKFTPTSIGDLPIVGIVPYNYYRGVFSTIPGSFQDIKNVPMNRVGFTQDYKPKKMSYSINLQKAFGVSKTEANGDDLFTSRFNSAPTNQAYFRICVQNRPGFNFVSPVIMELRLEQNVVLYNSYQDAIGDAQPA